MAIIVAGLSHRTVPLEVLEQLTFTPASLPKALARLCGDESVHEGVILSTCNRTEVYVTVHRFHPAVASLRRFLSGVSGVDEVTISDGWYVHYDDSAIRHLFGVASGVDSMVLGESQILGQVRDAYRVAQDEGAARRMLSALFQRALRVGKLARTRTEISRHVVSLPQAAARTAAEILGGLEGRMVVVLGAGRMGGLAARALTDLGCGELVVAGRTPERAAALASRLGGRGTGLDELPELLERCDALLTATSSGDPVVDRELLEQATSKRDAPLVAVDLGLPRDIDPLAADLPGVELRDIADLREVADRGAQRRRAELPKVERIIDEEVAAFMVWERSLALGPSIGRLRGWADEVRVSEVERAARRLGLDAEARDALDAAARTIANKLLHLPISRMKDLVQGPDGQVYLEAFQEIFDPDDGERA